MQRWFRQLRRLQSRLHNLRRASSSPSAVCYRLEVWQSIKSARGFAGSFAAWWCVRPHKLVGSPHTLPVDLPSVDLLELIFNDFRCNFRTFESWNLQQRRKTLSAVMRTDIRKAFQSLKEEAPTCPERFVHSTSAQVVDVDPVANLVHIDQPLCPSKQVTWTLDDVPVQVRALDHQLFEVRSSLPLMPGQELIMHSQLTCIADMQESLKSFWSARWQKYENISVDRWDRLIGFVRAYMPTLQFQLPAVTGPMWDQVNRRYASNAARGPDGFDHLDLHHMPMCYRDGIVGLLNAVEDGSPWPSQLLTAFCHPLPKHSSAAAVGDYRPIVIMSMLYRSWSALRSRSILAQLRGVVGAGVVIGFMPGRECGEIWHHVQALVELAFQSQTKLTGVVSDVRKAFESVPRSCLFMVARLLGLPDTLLSAWERFLSSFERHFVLHQHFGASIPSNWGLPEGCGLSVVGMTLIDWCWDIYQKAFAPDTIPLSYVDNYEVLARSLGELLTGFATLESFMELWSLDLDSAKTYFWSTSPADRGALRSLGKSVCLQQADLGGAMTYCRRTGLGAQQARLDSLRPLWSRLRRSAAPLQIKFQLLRQGFWSKAFHAIGITLLPFRHIDHLRTQAVRALGFGLAGANPAIRLSLLCDDMQTDPGFFQVVRVLADFRRFARKTDDILRLWQDFVHHFDGKLLSGPFSKLYEIFEQLEWSILEPPWFLDHDQCCWDLLSVASGTLHDLLRDAWCQRLARGVSHRQDFSDLNGLTWPPSRHEKRLSLVDVASINAIREGAFYVGSTQGKFDFKKGSLCPLCHQVDTVAHRCLSCPALIAARAQHGGIISRWSTLPRSLSEHLLSSRNPWFAARKRALLALPDNMRCFQDLDSSVTGWIDFFTDGSRRSCFGTGLLGGDFSLSWAGTYIETFDRTAARYQ